MLGPSEIEDTLASKRVGGILTLPTSTVTKITVARVVAAAPNYLYCHVTSRRWDYCASEARCGWRLCYFLGRVFGGVFNAPKERNQLELYVPNVCWLCSCYECVHSYPAACRSSNHNLVRILGRKYFPKQYPYAFGGLLAYSLAHGAYMLYARNTCLNILELMS